MFEYKSLWIVSAGLKPLENFCAAQWAHTLAAFDDVPNFFIRHGVFLVSIGLGFSQRPEGV
jgi:hypothetical protein